ncbi:hypothetical protein IJL65_00940 [bacterium]|nr:hypothetical protein [bacterium]
MKTKITVLLSFLSFSLDSTVLFISFKDLATVRLLVAQIFPNSSAKKSCIDLPSKNN